jgi:MraZ protein
MVFFRGQFQHSVDAKGRVAVPARFRDAPVAYGSAEVDAAPLQLVVSPALFDPCLHVYPRSAWETLEAKLADLPSMDPNIVRFRRLYVSAACECELDRSGRVLIPPHLRQKARLERDVLWAGMGRHLELWSTAEWEKANSMTPDEEARFKQAVLEQIKI